MLFTQTVDKTTLELLNILMNDPFFNDFILVGGTAVALHIGHRISFDIDLFTDNTFNQNLVVDHLRSEYGFHLDFISENTVKGEIMGVQIDCIAHLYSWISPFVSTDQIRIAGVTDLAAMKLNAIAGNGTRLKDYIDIAFLSQKLSFKQMLFGYETKYNSNPIVPVKALTWFNDINFNEPIKMSNNQPLNWDKIAKRLKAMQQNPDKVF